MQGVSESGSMSHQKWGHTETVLGLDAKSIGLNCGRHSEVACLNLFRPDTSLDWNIIKHCRPRMPQNVASDQDLQCLLTRLQNTLKLKILTSETTNGLIQMMWMDKSTGQKRVTKGDYFFCRGKPAYGSGVNLLNHSSSVGGKSYFPLSGMNFFFQAFH